MRTRHVIISLVAALAWATPAVAQSTDAPPEQVDVSVKIVEFQSSNVFETGFSAFFVEEAVQNPGGSVTANGSTIRTADLTFPTSGTPTITAFLDRIQLGDGDVEIILQALAEENKAFILSRPKAKVMLGGSVTLGTTQEIPFQATQVVGTTAIEVTKFRETGVSLTLSLEQVTDDDGDWTTTNDTFMLLNINAEVSEQGQNFFIALDQNVVPGSNFNQAQNVIQAPEFVRRQIKTKAWVRNGQVLVLGGLFRRTKQKSLRTAPWLTQAEDATVGLAERLVPGDFISSPISSTFGNSATSEDFRELVFIIKADVWRPALTTFEFFEDDAADEEDAEAREPMRPTDVIEGILDIPRGIAEGLSRPREGGVQDDLGGAPDE